MQNRKLARSIADLGFYECKRQLIYKAHQYGEVVKEVVELFFPSSKTGSVCDAVYRDLTLGMRAWTCPQCGAALDRYVNGKRYADQILTAT